MHRVAFFQILHDIGENGSYLPVVLSLALENTANKDELILRAGAEAGALLVDGMGDGVMIHSNNPQFHLDIDTLRQTSFNCYRAAACAPPRPTLYLVLRVAAHCSICKR